jgi:hypothetical protein
MTISANPSLRLAAESARRDVAAKGLMHRLMKMFKSMDADDLDDVIDVVDSDDPSSNWDNIRRTPPKAVLGVGEKMEASGKQEQLDRDPYPQTGNQNETDKLGAMFKAILESIESLTSAIKAGKNIAPGPVSDASEIEDEEEDDEKQIEKALSGLALKNMTVRDVLNAVRGDRTLRQPPNFLKAAAPKPNDNELLDSLNPVQQVRLMKSRQLLTAAARGVQLHPDNVAEAMRVVENPRCDTSFGVASAEIQMTQRLQSIAERGVHVSNAAGGEAHLPRS